MNKKISCIFAAIILVIALLLPANGISRLYTFVSGGVIRSSELNAEFNQIITAINNITSGVTTYTLMVVDNLKLDANTLSSTSGKLILAPLSGQDLELTPAGAGKTNITYGGLTISTGDQTLTNGNSIWTAKHLSTDTNILKSTDTNGNITLKADGSGQPIASNATYTTNLLKDYATIYNNTDQTTGASSAGTYYQITFETAGSEKGSDGRIDANDDILISHTGNYRISYFGKARHATAEKRETFRVKKNNGATDFPESQCEIKTGSDNYPVFIGNSFVVELTAGDTVELWGETETASATITHRITLSVNEI
jgi:hypothetical protein